MSDHILKVASPILWGNVHIFYLKMITFMLKVVIEDYFFQWDTSSEVVLSPLDIDYSSCFDYMSITHDATHIKSRK